MKTQIKAALLAVALSACAGNVFGQGQVTMANNSSSLVMNVLTGQPVAIGSTSFQLYYGPAGTPEANLLPASPIAGTSAVLAGRIANTVIDIPTNSVPYGGAATFQIRAWRSSYASYDLAFQVGDLAGKSLLFNANTSPNLTPPATPTSLAGLYPGFALFPVPEPSTFALAGLGLASLLLFRRRKSSHD